MTAHRMRARLTRVASLGLTTLVALSLVLSTSFSADAAKTEKAKPSKLGPHDLELIAAARANGESTITLLIAASGGRNNAVASAVAGLGGAIRYRDDGLDYLRVKIAIDAAEKVAALAGVEAVDVDEIIPIGLPSPDAAMPVAPQPASSAFDGWAVSTTDTTDNTSAVAIIETVAFKDPDIVFSSNVERR